jgi:lipopolysaccharide/colanic/teichoic acid biosynthesis glycosyltransferase
MIEMNDIKTSWTDSMTQKMSAFFEKENIQTAIRNKVLDPIMNYILKRIFPYIILICVMFILLLVSVLVTLAVIIYKFRPTVIAAVSEEK